MERSNLTLVVNSEENIRCIRFSGRLDVATCGELDHAILHLARQPGLIILDLTECSYLSSAGIRILLKTSRQLQGQGDDLILAGVVPEVLRVLEIASLTRVLRLEPSLEKALEVAAAGLKTRRGMSEATLQGHQLEYLTATEEPLSGTCDHDGGVLSFKELGFAIGFASFAWSSVGEPESPDFFVSVEKCSGFFPANDSMASDCRIISDPGRTGLKVWESLSFGSHPTGSLHVTTPGRFPLRSLSRATREIQEIGLTAGSVVFAVVINQDPGNPSVAMVIGVNEALVELVRSTGLALFGKLVEHTGTGSLTGITICLAQHEAVTPSTPLRELLERLLTFENIISVEPVDQEAMLQNPVAWLFHAIRFDDERTRTPAIELMEETKFESPRPFLARQLYPDCSRLVIDPLHGGYSAQTFHVTSFDREGRKMHPSVMKIAHSDLISRESERSRKYASPYIFNNCAMVLGSAQYGDVMAIRYNFVGIGGEASQLRWLTHYYHEQDTGFLEPVFDKIFQQILKPWYGQPVRKTIYPFRDHDPTLTFFPHIFKTAEELFSISPKTEQIHVEELDVSLVNPFWFLKNEYPRRAYRGMEYFSGICHGDLNMQNILLDEAMNVYLIDFSETRPRSVISDFARLEAIFLVDNAPLEGDADFTDYLHFVTRFYEGSHLTDLPGDIYSGRHTEKMNKNVALARKMRQYALEAAGGDPDPFPYYMALLEWVLPVICYTVPRPVKRLSVIVSALLAGKVSDLLLPVEG